jgi:hypothetical protein
VHDYLDSLDAGRSAIIYGRLRLLEQLPYATEMPSPPFATVPSSDLITLLVDYDGEVHEVVFGKMAETWFLVHAFRATSDAVCDQNYSIARLRWATFDRLLSHESIRPLGERASGIDGP